MSTYSYDDDSSDDETPPPPGRRPSMNILSTKSMNLTDATPLLPAIITWHCTIRHNLTKHKRQVDLDLGDRMITQHLGKGKIKTIPCEEFTAFTRIQDSPDMLRITLTYPTGKTKDKKWQFESEFEATMFMKYVHALNECGKALKSTFDTIDKQKTGRITKNALKRAMQKDDRNINDELLLEMMSLAQTSDNLDPNNRKTISKKDNVKYIDFTGFFKLFMYTPVYTVTQCLGEWENKVVTAENRKNNESTERQNAMNRMADQRGQAGIPVLLSGEILQNIVDNVRYTWLLKGGTPLVGTMYFTNYRLIFASYVKNTKGMGHRHETPEPFHELSIPLSSVLKVETKDGRLTIYTRDIRILYVSFDANAAFVETLLNVVKMSAFPPLNKVFAYRFKKHFKPTDIILDTLSNSPFPLVHSADLLTPFYATKDDNIETKEIDLPPSDPITISNGWEIYDARREFTRQGVLSHHPNPETALWRIYSDNFALSPTYPLEFILPSLLSESEILVAAKYRSKKRIPALTWRNPRTGAIMARSSQPMAGMIGHRCTEDEKLLNLYRVRGNPNDLNEIENPSDFYIIDARKSIAATGNQIKGKGVENASNYYNTTICFQKIENIHTMRNCLNNLVNLLTPNFISSDDHHYYEKLEAIGWSRHIRLILEGSISCAEKLQLEGSSILIHCSDGWDRTAQLCATTQLLLDPYYRTIEGLCVLIQKDWCDFGHKFQDRCGHADSNITSQERSPIFLQWLDVCHQLLYQFPACFEYTQDILVFLANHLYSCLFGTFLGNSVKVRKEELDVYNKTHSIWTYILKAKKSFLNKSFIPHQGPIWPSANVRKIKLWEQYYCRFDPDLHPKSVSGLEWLEDWGIHSVRIHNEINDKKIDDNNNNDEDDYIVPHNTNQEIVLNHISINNFNNFDISDFKENNDISQEEKQYNEEQYNDQQIYEVEQQYYDQGQDQQQYNNEEYQEQQQYNEDQQQNNIELTNNESINPWVIYSDEEGRQYYYNTVTGDSRWDQPDEFVTG